MMRVSLLGLVLTAPLAHAHFKLNAPTSATVENVDGNPQKSYPCGLSDSPTVVDQSTKTNAVTTVQTGSMLAIKLNETIFHPGHYRVAIAQDMTGLPPDPPVTAGAQACGTTTIMTNPALPIVADGLLVHTSPFSGEQTAMVQLPAGMTCTNCVLQVIEFMSNHGLNNPGGCFYHHCATITISNTAPDGPPVTSEVGDVVDGPPGTGGGDGGGCCSADGGAATGVFGLALFAMMLRRRRQ